MGEIVRSGINEEWAHSILLVNQFKQNLPIAVDKKGFYFNLMQLLIMDDSIVDTRFAGIRA